METSAWGAPRSCNEEFFNKICAQKLGPALGLVVYFYLQRGARPCEAAVTGAVVLGHPTPRSGDTAQGTALSPVRRSRNRHTVPFCCLIPFLSVFLTQRVNLSLAAAGKSLFGICFCQFVHRLLGAARPAGFDLSPCFNSKCQLSCLFHPTPALPCSSCGAFFPILLPRIEDVIWTSFPLSKPGYLHFCLQ